MFAPGDRDYTSVWRAREKQRTAQIQRLQDHLSARLPFLRQVLIAHGVQEAYIFGSFASDRLRPESDLDLAVAGAEATTWYQLSAELERAAQLNLDMIDLDSAPPALKERIISTGRRIAT